MAITIDRAGRVVIPKALREECHLVPGSELEAEAVGHEIRLRPVEKAVSLAKKRGLLVHHGPGVSEVDVVVIIKKSREGLAIARGRA
ncbi:MAG: AbrB/MazE/SpoVT family DNA-binding domain-containing protein [Verrucomicrobiae bacterium]|nr:AbrB/MazE/SpoVT family DNA-binding domain-containing protein [Verrucomicrobiae bacterium]